MVMKLTSQNEIEKSIDSLPNKISCGHDKISNILLKHLKKYISYPLMLIFNQSIATGCFPSQMKVAEVIPLYKGKERDEVINYCPVSLLVMISKLLEKIVYTRTFQYLDQNQVLYDSQYGFCSKRSCHQAILELTGVQHAKSQHLIDENEKIWDKRNSS